jgi:hypothetical protein
MERQVPWKIVIVKDREGRQDGKPYGLNLESHSPQKKTEMRAIALMYYSAVCCSLQLFDDKEQEDHNQREPVYI